MARGSELSHPRQDWSALRLVLGAQVPAGRRGLDHAGLARARGHGPSGAASRPDRLWGAGALSIECALDIPRLHLSSGERLPTGPGNILLIDLPTPQTAMKDPDQAIPDRS